MRYTSVAENGIHSNSTYSLVLTLLESFVVRPNHRATLKEGGAVTTSAYSLRSGPGTFWHSYGHEGFGPAVP